MVALRNIWRRKVRTALTIFGIAVGIFALVVMGSLANRLNKSIGLGKQYITGQITITPKGGGTIFSDNSSGLVITRDQLDQVARVPGVAAVQAQIMLPVKTDSSGAGFGAPETIWGQDLSVDFKNKNIKKLGVAQGRMVKNGDTDQITVGSQIAASNGWKVGRRVTIRGHSFTVVGILEQTLSGPDQYVLMPLAPAQELLVASNPLLTSLKSRSESSRQITDQALSLLPADQQQAIRDSQTFDQSTLATGASAYWKDGENPSEVAKRIKKDVPQIDALDPAAIGKQIDQASAIFNLIVLGSALIALLVGSLSVINTMIMAIGERTREIGIQKAVGAPTGAILRQYLTEAGLLGAIGGLLGLGGGSLLVWALNQKGRSTGSDIFLLSPAFAVGVVIFAVILGVVAGLYPAISAARLDPVKALRSE